MSLTKTNIAHNVKKQYTYKLKSYVWVFNSLILLQLLAILFSSLGGTGSSGSGGGDSFYLQTNYYSTDIVIVFTMLWAFIISTQITSNKENEFTFVMNKVSNNLSDAAFLFTASIIGGITAILSRFLLKVIIHFLVDPTIIVQTNLVSNPKYIIIGTLATILFIFLCGGLGYIVGTLVQLNRIFIFLLPVLFFSLTSIAHKYGENNFMLIAYDFYFKESIFTIFSIKIVITSVLLFLGAFIISKRLEVRR